MSRFWERLQILGTVPLKIRVTFPSPGEEQVSPSERELSISLPSRHSVPTARAPFGTVLGGPHPCEMSVCAHGHSYGT